jgi:hypothetical protein
MSQYRTGTVNVTNGSATVTGDTTTFTGNVSSGDLFTVVGSGVTYQIASVSSANTLVLSIPYYGATAAGASYTIARDFTPNLSLPYISKGDVETATILKAQAAKLDALAAAGGLIIPGPPGPAGTTPTIIAGTGITSSTSGTTTTIGLSSTNTLAAGTGLALSTAAGTTTIGLASTNTLAVGSGLTLTTSGGTTTLALAATNTLAAGTGLTLTTASGTTTIGLTSTNTLAVGSGLTLTTSGGTTTIALASTNTLAAGTGISLTTSGGTTTVANTGVTTFNSRSGAVSPTTGDYTFSQVSGSLAASQLPPFTGDVTSPAGSSVNTLATVNSNVGSFGTATATGSFTVNAKGLITAASSTAITYPVTSVFGRTGAVVAAANDYSFSQVSGSLAASQLPAFTGDVTSPSGSSVNTLATVNSNVGSFTNANITVNAKGLITSASNGSGSTTATNLAGGANGSIPYQTGSGATTFLAAGTNGYVLTLASGIPTWAAASGGGGVTSAVAGTGISVSAATGAVTFASTATLANVTALGATTSTAVSLTAGTAASSTTTGTLIVTGGVGVSGTLYSGGINTSGMYVGGGVTMTGALSGVTTISGSGNLTLQNPTAATSSTNYSSPQLTLGGTIWSGTASVNDTFYLQSTYAAGTEPIATLNIFHSGSTGGSSLSYNGNFAISGSGYVSKYNSTTTAGIGMVPIYGVANLTAQTANVAATTITSAPSAGLYRVSVYSTVTTAATSSSTLPDVEIIYTDQDTSVVRTVQVTAGNSGNTTSASAAQDVIINAKNATNIQYAVGQNQAYASSGATAMQYACRIRLEYLG